MDLFAFVMSLNKTAFDCLRAAVERRIECNKEPELVPEEVELLKQNRLIDAIKSVRDRLGYGIREAKMLCEAHPEFKPRY